VTRSAAAAKTRTEHSPPHPFQTCEQPNPEHKNRHSVRVLGVRVTVPAFAGHLGDGVAR